LSEVVEQVNEVYICKCLISSQLRIAMLNYPKPTKYE